MKQMSAQEAAKQWNISLRRVQDYCRKGKVPGAQRFGTNWMIPSDAQKPTDGRTKAAKQTEGHSKTQMPRKTPFLHMTNLYCTAGSASKSIAALADYPEAQTLLAAELSYSMGQIEKAYEGAYALLHKHSGFYAVISAGMLLSLCAIWRGDLSLWRQAKIHIAEAPAKTDTDRDIMDFSITAVDSMLYNVVDFPEWFKIGRFEVLPADSLPAVKVFYAKYLYVGGYAVATKQMEMPGVQGLSLMSLLPSTIEPMISQAQADNSIIAEIYLRMTCAVVYHNSGNDKEACFHIDRAIDLALPDKLYGLLAEYCRTLDSLLEQRLLQKEPAAWEVVNSLYQVYNKGWSKLSGAVRGRTIITTLSPKQREVAKLAAFGMKNNEIAAALHMSVSAVKQAVANVSNKMGVSREDFAAFL